MSTILILCTTDSMIYNFLIPHIHDMQNNGYRVVCACSRTGDFFDILQNKYGFNMFQINFERSPYNLRNVNAYGELVKLINREKIDIVFCHEPVGGAMGRMAGHICKCKVIYMAHGFHFFKGASKGSKIYYFVERWLSKYTDVLITINQEDYEASKEFSAKKNIKLNGIGVDTSIFVYNRNEKYIREELSLTSNDIILLSVGELIHRKNHETVIEALKYLDEKYHYVVVGDGELLDHLKRIIKEFRLINRVHLLGYRRDISHLCNSADIFLMPSYQEGLSVALMEAMSCGLPVIASRIRGNVDLIDEGKGGFLVDVEDAAQYADAITRVIENSNEQNFGEYNQMKVKQFDISAVRKEMKIVFKEM